MTRINMGIKVQSLTDEHLLAEHREIKRLPGYYRDSLRSGSINRVPKKFSLGKGHVLFFVDKPAYTLKRYKQVYRECLRRGFSVQDYSDNWDVYPVELFSRSTRATNKTKQLLTERISLRILESTKTAFHYYGDRLSKKSAITLLNSMDI